MVADTRKTPKSSEAGKARNAGEPETIIIKKYANRRLYDTRASRYVTLENLAEMVRAGDAFEVVDAKTGEDLTRQVLAQIIFDAEAKGANMLPTNFLRHIIEFYGDSLQSLLPEYLDHTMAAFSGNQSKLRDQMGQTGSMLGMQQWEEIGRRNMEIFERAAEMFSPFATGPGSTSSLDEAEEPASGSKDDPADRDGEQLDALKSQLDALQRQLDGLTRGRNDS
ncbi:MAG: polyhydroxyalkanoate synthesis repressor PhaR [Alphaproteobacteria bacterium]|nr:polyhydroxyalkanoate synthesis repressor PhaR [Alphaproteobacteria bacterium]